MLNFCIYFYQTNTCIMKKFLLILFFFSGIMASNSVMAVPVSGTSEAITPDITSISMDNLKDLSVSEVEAMIGKKLTLKEKLTLKYVQHKLKKSSEGGNDYDPILIYVLCFFIPPVAVYLLYDIGSEFWVNVLLTLLCGLPGIVHAFIICSKKLK